MIVYDLNHNQTREIWQHAENPNEILQDLQRNDALYDVKPQPYPSHYPLYYHARMVADRLRHSWNVEPVQFLAMPKVPF